MPKHRYIRYTLGLATCAAVGSTLALWRLGLAPVYAWLASMNGMALLLYGYDKRQAVVAGMRIPELVLHATALFGGTGGALLGQGLFRHKTRKRGFQIVFAAIVLLQAASVYGYWRYLRG
jgi:uncharacterized membrane protein YsdA (DUF1294 family)